MNKQLLELLQKLQQTNADATSGDSAPSVVAAANRGMYCVNGCNSLALQH